MPGVFEGASETFMCSPDAVPSSLYQPSVTPIIACLKWIKCMVVYNSPTSVIQGHELQAR